jgi:hypothetical protein
METRDGHRYFGVYWGEDTRWAQVLWSLLGWRHEMGTGILKLIGMETLDGRKTVELIGVQTRNGQSYFGNYLFVYPS